MFGATAETALLVTQLDLKDGLTPGLQRASGAVSHFSDGVSASLKRAGKGVGQVGAGLARVGAIAATVAVGGIAVATKAASDFGGKMAIINTIAQVSDARLAQIGNGIKDFSVKTGAATDDLTDGYYDLLSAGVKVKDAQKELELAWKLGRGSLATTAESVDFLTTAQNAYGLSSRGVAKAADQMAMAVQDGKVKLSEISATFADVAPVAAQAHIGINQIAAAYGFLTARGVTAGSVTTQMSRAIIELSKPRGALAELEKTTGRSYIAIAGKEGLVPALQQMRDDAKKAGVPFIDLFGRMEAYKFALSTTGANLRDFNKEQERVNKANGTTDEQAAKRNKGLEFQLGRLRAAAKVGFIEFGEAIAPAIGRVADRLTAFIAKNRDEIKRLGRDAGDFVESIPWEKVLDGAKTFLGLLKQAWGVLKLIPTEVTLTVGAFLGLNKLSGGLIGTGLTNIAGGLIGAVTKGVASRAPGVGQFVAQPVYVTNWPVGMGGAGGAGAGAAGAAAGGGRSMIKMLGRGLLGLGIGLGAQALGDQIGGDLGAATSSLGAIAGAFVAGGPVLGALVAVTTAITTVSDELGTIGKAQQSNREKAEQVGGNISEAGKNLANMSRLIEENRGDLLKWAAINTTSAGEIGAGMKNAADALVKGLTRDNQGSAVATLVEAQRQAQAAGWTDVADAIGRDLEAARRWMPKPETFASAVLKGSQQGVAAGIGKGERKREHDISARLRGALDHVGQVSSHKGNRALFERPMERLYDLMKKAFMGDHTDRGALKEAIRVAERQQRRALEHGHTKLARNLGHDIDRMKRALGSKQDTANTKLTTIAGKDTKVSVTTTVSTSVSVRDTQTSVNVSKRYGMQAV